MDIWHLHQVVLNAFVDVKESYRLIALLVGKHHFLSKIRLRISEDGWVSQLRMYDMDGSSLTASAYIMRTGGMGGSKKAKMLRTYYVHSPF